MDYYQNVVIDYLRADRAVFVNTECCIQISPGSDPPKGTLWYCDAVAADFRSGTVFLCEITYSVQLAALVRKLKTWHDNWKEIRDALADYSSLPTHAREGFPKSWALRPWLFVPEDGDCLNILRKKLEQMRNGQPLAFTPRITPLEMVQPWRYCNWDRKGEIACCARHACAKPTSIPEAMAK